MSYSTLKTKVFIPPLQSRLVPRPRLVQQIDTAIKNGISLILIAAPAGFGKTTAISSWAHLNSQQTAWISLDETDNEPAVFWTYAIAAIQTNWPNFAKALFQDLTTSPLPPIESILPEFVNELAGMAQPVTLVLDDYHVVSNREIHAGLTFLLSHRPPLFHLAIATRADPPLPIARLRAQMAMLELRAEDLRFTFQEAQILLNKIMELGLTDEDVKLLERRTEGWGVGLLLAAQSMQGLQDKHRFISAFSGSHAYILEYLVEEVIKHQHEPMRAFLLRTSILDQLSGSLCDTVTGEKGSAERLAQLYKQQLFIIPLDPDHSWYRYHHLFGDLLANQLQKIYPQSEIHKLHLRASHWYQNAGNLDKAVQYALTGQDYEQAAGLIELAATRTIARGQVSTLLQWIQALPEDVVRGHPVLLMRQGWTTFLSGNVSQASQILTKAQQILADLPAGAERELLQGQLFAMLATLTALTSDLPTAIAQAREALDKLPREQVIYRARALRALGVCHTFLGKIEQALAYLEAAKGLALEGHNKFLAAEILSQIATAQKHQGRLKEAFATYQHILELYEVPDENPPAGLGSIGLAEISLEWNDLEAADHYLTAGIEQCTRGSIGYALQPAFLIQGLLKQARGDEAGALEATTKGKNRSRVGGGSMESILGLAGFQARLDLQLGRLGQAKAWATGELLPSGWSFVDLPPVLYELQQSLLAQVYARSGEPEQALAIVEAVYGPAHAGGRLARCIELALSKALALQSVGKEDQAIEVFRNCLALAESQGYVRLFLEAGEPIWDLLHQTATGGSQAAYAGRLLRALDGSQPSEDRPGSVQTALALVEPLTGRELEVLRLLCEGCTNQQIAEALVLSENTIKKHTSNIYGKLGVHNRTQAIIQAQSIGLI